MHDDDIDLAYCPNCGKEVYEFVEKCPHCRDWITPTYRNPRRGCVRRLLMATIVALLIFALLRLFWM